ncbi:MAG: acyl--CoA ligase [Proteobacteria bacterium]|nr:acyl--CoA ligase [Pseudomonadota bacterium]
MNYDQRSLLSSAAQRSATAIRSARARLAALSGKLSITDFYETLARHHGHRQLWFAETRLEFAGFDSAGLSGVQIRDVGNKIANALTAACPLERNNRVLIFKSNHPDYLWYSLSTVMAGGIPILANNKTGWDFAAKLQTLTGAGWIITDSATLSGHEDSESVRALERAGVIFLLVDKSCGNHGKSSRFRHFFADIEHAPTTARPPRALADDTPVAMFHTSGTTGTPKCCVWTRRNLRRIWAIGAASPLSSRARGLITTPFSHCIYTALQPPLLLAGGQSHLMVDFDARRCLQTIDRLRITHYMGFPYTFMRMAAEDFADYRLDSMKMWCTGADKAHAAHIRKFIARGAVRWKGYRGSFFVDTYGSTEIGFGGIVKIWAPGSTPRPCVQGKPVPHEFSVRVVDRAFNPVPRGTVGRILVKSSTHFAGYWNRHDAWAENRIDGWWWPGDVGRINQRGELEFLDREVDSVDTAEGRLYTLPIEESLLGHEGIMEAAVFQAPRHDTRTYSITSGVLDRNNEGERSPGDAVAWVVPSGWLRRGHGDPGAEALSKLERLLLARANAGRQRARLAAVRAVPLEEIPFGVTGKVLKRTLRDTAAHIVHDESNNQKHMALEATNR